MRRNKPYLFQKYNVSNLKLTNRALCIIGILLATALGYVVWISKVQILSLPVAVEHSVTANNKSAAIHSIKWAAIHSIKWAELLPEKEKSILTSYENMPASNEPAATSDDPFADRLFNSLNASVDPDYAEAMYSFNTVSRFDNMQVTVPGFIVPLAFNDQQQPTHIFIVPYFGACLHFPPPPPNQMIYAQLTSPLADFAIEQAYQITGIMKRGLFEDPLGSSAYIIDITDITPYDGEPDDVRQH